MSTNKYYKYCIVPKCKSSTVTTPNKLFISVPKNSIIRKKWCVAMKRCLTKNKPLSDKSVRFCCEDHFNLQDDLENYLRVKMMGGNMITKKGVVPHIFDCQKTVVSASRKTGQRRNNIKVLEDVLNLPKSTPSVNTECHKLQTGVVSDDTLEQYGENVAVVATEPLSSGGTQVDKAVQVSTKVKYRSKSTSTRILTVQTACSPMKFQNDDSTNTYSIKEENLDSSCSVEDLDLDSSYSVEDLEDINFHPSSEDQFDGSFIDQEALKATMRKAYIFNIEKNPRLYLGIPSNMYHVISELASHIPTEVIHILITLKKIRLNLSYNILADHFGMSATSVCRSFTKTLQHLALYLKELIFWPETHDIRIRLPIAFRARYANVESIIDCFEIQIEKPSNPMHQSLTWSEYKGCNTLKYLISCTPDGLVNFVSCGYGGRGTDAMIVEDCGYLKHLRAGMGIMADRGFKNVSHIIQQQNCVLIRPPSVFCNVPSNQKEVKESKRIAALRIHVERVISRVREFHMLRTHSTLDKQLIPHIDNIVIIACGIINLQGLLTKM